METLKCRKIEKIKKMQNTQKNNIIIKSMRKITILCFLLLWGSVYAQDLIVTNSGDSLNCKITKVKNEEIHFTYKHLGKIMSMRLRLDEIKVSQFKYFEVPEVPVEKVLAMENYPRIRIALNGGYAYRIARIDPEIVYISKDLTDYMKKLKHGFNYGLDFSYYFNKYCGIGIGYNAFQSKNKIENYDLISPYYPLWGEINDNIRIDFVGAFLNSRLLHANNKNALLFGLGVGYIRYYDKGKANYQDVIIKGGSVGLRGNMGYDISINKNIAIGFQFSYIFGILTQVKVYNGDYFETAYMKENENLSRIDLSVGLRFNIWKL